MKSGKQAAAMASAFPRLLCRSFLKKEIIEDTPDKSLRIGCRSTRHTVSEVFKQMVKPREPLWPVPAWDERLASLCIAPIIQLKPLARLGLAVHRCRQAAREAGKGL